MADPQDPTTPPPGGQMPLGGDGGAKNLIPINIEDEMKRSYLDYAMSVIVGRALPDVRDGLKPVHRRILYMMHEMGLHFNRPTKKSARVVGDVMGKLHPHGDSAIYDALVRMAQPFSMRYPLIDGQGNYGSVDGDPPAAMRYTEARLARIAAELLEDIDKETVDFKPNYDEQEVEPEVLPTRIPNLLINGSEGIAVGMASKIPPHNITEIVNACIALVQNPGIGLPKIAESEQFAMYSVGEQTYLLVQRHEGTPWMALRLSGDALFRISSLLGDAMRHLYRDVSSRLSPNHVSESHSRNSQLG